jgi:hypothetical protein
MGFLPILGLKSVLCVFLAVKGGSGGKGKDDGTPAKIFW